MNKSEQLRFVIGRFDHYYDSVNNKGSFYIGLNTFIFGGICVGYLGLYAKVEMNCFVWLILTALALVNVASILLTIDALTPFLTGSNNSASSPSLLYFGGISREDFQTYKLRVKGQEDEELLDDLIEQSHCLAKGLERKYDRLKLNSKLIFFQFCLMLPLLLLIIKNLKS